MLFLFYGRQAWAAPVQVNVPFMTVHARDYIYANGDGFQDGFLWLGSSDSLATTDGTTTASASFTATDLGDTATWDIDIAQLTKTQTTEYVEAYGIVRFTTNQCVDYKIIGDFTGSGSNPDDTFSASAFVVDFDTSIFSYSEADSERGLSFVSSFNGNAEGNYNAFLEGTPTGVLVPGLYQFQFRFIIGNEDQDRMGSATAQGNVTFMLTKHVVPEPTSLVSLAMLIVICTGGYRAIRQI
jgi:hypothetical protein